MMCFVTYCTTIILSTSGLLKKGFRKCAPSIVQYYQVSIGLLSWDTCSWNARLCLFSSVSPMSGTRAWCTACVRQMFVKETGELLKKENVETEGLRWWLPATELDLKGRRAGNALNSQQRGTRVNGLGLRSSLFIPTDKQAHHVGMKGIQLRDGTALFPQLDSQWLNNFPEASRRSPHP